MQTYLVAEFVKRYVLVIATGNKYRLCFKCVQAGCRSCGACADGIVNKSNSVQHPHLFKAMLNSRKAFGYRYACVIINIAACRRESGHVVFKIVRSGKLNIVGRHYDL